MRTFGFMTMAAAFLLTACSSSPFRFQWNEWEEYGTYYPSAFRKLNLAGNGKGFTASDGTATLWADTYLFLSLEELPADFPAEIRQAFEEDGMIWAEVCLQGKSGPMTVADTTMVKDGIRERKKTVAYRDAFYTVSYSYPESKAERYRYDEDQIFDTFPVWQKKG